MTAGPGCHAANDVHRLFRLAGQVAVVTGAARGLGAAMAQALAEAGADILIVDCEDATSTLAAIRALGRKAEALERNLADLNAESATVVVHECVSLLGRLDILVNNAGIIRRAPALDVAEHDWRSVLAIDLDAVFLLCQASARYWVSAGKPGKVINIASMLSFQGGVMVPAYTAAKSAIAGLTRALANEWAALGINVNAIAPGYMETEVTAAIRADPDRNRAIVDRIPAGRWGRPSDLAGAVVFLASAASDYVHGAVLPVDGGWLAR